MVPQNSLYTFDIKYLTIIFLFSSRHQYEHKRNLFGMIIRAHKRVDGEELLKQSLH